MRVYFIHDGNDQQGPFPIDALQSQNISKTTPVWYEGLAEWTTVAQVPELHALVKTPPPFQSERLSTPPPTPSVPSYNYPSEEPKKKSYTIPFITAGILAIALIGWLIYNNQSQASQLETHATQLSEIQIEKETKQTEQEQKELERKRINEEITKKNREYRNNWFSYIDAKPNQYQYREIGGIFNLQVVVTNNTEYLLDELTATVSYIKSNGDVWKSIEVPVYNIAANSEKRISVDDVQRGTSVQISIAGIQSKKMHFCYAEGNWAKDSDDPYFCK